MTTIVEYRYYVDLRIGMCAIIDSHVKNKKTESLSENSPHVVKYWHSVWDEYDKIWYIPLKVEIEAYNICKQLNSEYEKSKQEKK